MSTNDNDTDHDPTTTHDYPSPTTHAIEVDPATNDHHQQQQQHHQEDYKHEDALVNAIASASEENNPHATAHAYASNGLEILQAATDAAAAAQALQHDSEALQRAAAVDVDVPSSVDGNGLPDMNGRGPGSHDASMLSTYDQHAYPPPQQGYPSPQLQHSPTHGQQSPAAGGASSRDPNVNPKLTRLRRACDMCSMRKVKCDDTNIPCRPCRELGVDCTYRRETKRRGPPNKHAEAAKAAKRMRMDVEQAAAVEAAAMNYVEPAPNSPQSSITKMKPTTPVLPPSFPKGAAGELDAEALAPMPVLELLVDDFFTYVHPLAPFPHEPTFRQSFSNREDRKNPEFLGLLASMICALAASFPRSTRGHHLKSQDGSQEPLTRATSMVEKCRDVALATRGSRWVLKQPKTLDDAATSFFLGVASGYIQQRSASRHFMAETLTLIRQLGFQQSSPTHPDELPTFGSTSLTSSFDHVKDQIGKRIFWSLLLSLRSFSQLRTSHADPLIAPSTPSLPYPARPENVDDHCILADQIIHQPEGTVTLLTGSRFGIDIYTTMNGIVSLELAYGMSTLPWADQRLLLRDGLLAAKSIVANLPPELQPVNPDSAHPAYESLNGHDHDPDTDSTTPTYAAPQWPNPQPANDIRETFKTQPLRRRQVQHDIQRASLFIAQLTTRNYFVERYFSLRDTYHAEKAAAAAAAEEEAAADPSTAFKEQVDDDDDDDGREIHNFMTTERDLILQGLFSFVTSPVSLHKHNLQPTAGFLLSSIIQIATSLLQNLGGQYNTSKSEAELKTLIDVFTNLERTSAAPWAATTTESSSTTTTGFPPFSTLTDDGAEAGQAGQQQLYMMTGQDEKQEERNWAALREFQDSYATWQG